MRVDPFARICLMYYTGVVLKNAEIGISEEPISGEFHSKWYTFQQIAVSLN